MEKSTLALLAALVVVVAAVGGAVVLMQDDDNDDGPNTVTDVRGRVVTLPDEVNRIVCLQAGAARLAVYLDAGDMIVGVDAMDAKVNGPKPLFEHATYRLVVDTSKAIEMTPATVVEDGKMYNVGGPENYKAIQMTQADIILCTEPEKAKLDTLQMQTGIPVVGLHAEGNLHVNDSELTENLRVGGKAVGKEARAEQLIQGIQDTVHDLEQKCSKVATDTKQGCYVGGMVSGMQGGFFRTTGNYYAFDLGGARNVMPDNGTGNPYDTDVKTVASSGAQYIFVDSIKSVPSQNQFNEQVAQFTNLPAIEDDNIYSLYTYKFYGTNWESELLNAYYVGHVLHPEVYGGDAEFKQSINDVLDLFFPDSGLNFDRMAELQGPGAMKLDWLSQ